MSVALFQHDGAIYERSDVLTALRRAGVRNGSSVFVHSDLRAFGGLAPAVNRSAFLDGFLSALQDAIGPSGTLIMPTFTFSFCKQEVFDPAVTPSTVGILTEYFRKQPGVSRSMDPIFSVAARGPLQAHFTDVGTDCFGERSVFEKLFDADVTLVFLGPRFDITYGHFVEQRWGVSYRFLKEFSGTVMSGGIPQYRTYTYNVRPLDQGIEFNHEGIARAFDHRGILHRAVLGGSQVRTVGARAASRVMTEGFVRDPYHLLMHPPRPQAPTVRTEVIDAPPVVRSLRNGLVSDKKFGG